MGRAGKQCFNKTTALVSEAAAAVRMFTASLPNGHNVGCRVFITHKTLSAGGGTTESCQMLGGILIAKISTATVSNQLFLSVLLCFSCRACEVGGSLCHMSEGRYKNCQQREAQ